MKLQEWSSSKELMVITHAWDPQSSTIAGRIAVRVRALYDGSIGSMSRKIENLFWKSSQKAELIVVTNIQKSPLEELMGNVSKGIDELEDDSIMTYARGLHSMFWNKVKRDRKTKIDYINKVIIPLTWEGNQELPTLLIGELNAVIMGFSKLIKERIRLTKKEKVARLK
jgi:hypothetical protein